MQETDKKIKLAFFVLLFMNSFYALIIKDYLYLVYFSFTLVVAYTIIYPDGFFHAIETARNYKQNNKNMDKGNNGTNVYSKMEDYRDDNEGHEKERISNENIKNSNKGSSYPSYY